MSLMWIDWILHLKADLLDVQFTKNIHKEWQGSGPHQDGVSLPLFSSSADSNWKSA